MNNPTNPAANGHDDTASLSRLLIPGCYEIQYTPDVLADDGGPHYDGTLRVEHDRRRRRILASGDLYIHPQDVEVSQNPPKGIPIFPRDDYRYYLALKGVSEPAGDADRGRAAKGFTLELESHEYDAVNRSWTHVGDYSATMKLAAAPSGYPTSVAYYEGDVWDLSDRHGSRNGTLRMAWVSGFFRRAVIEIDRVPGADPIHGGGTGTSWEGAFKLGGWDVQIVQRDRAVPEDDGHEWTRAELHEAMLQHRDDLHLDLEWRYYVLSVGLIADIDRGFKFDAFGSDSDKLCREVAVVESHYQFPREAPWDEAQGKTLGAIPLYFRVAVHEVGHAMNLEHNDCDNGFMNTTDQIAENLKVGRGDFPDDVKYKFAPGDMQRLRHLPDIIVRPGTPSDPCTLPTTQTPVLMFDGAEENPAPRELADATFDAHPIPGQTEIPLGAPVRLNLQLSLKARMKGHKRLPRLNFPAGHISGTVKGPDQVERSFASVVWEADATARVDKLVVSDSVTLLRGAQGWLFPVAGEYTIKVNFSWKPRKREVTAQTEARVMVTPPQDAAHALAARRIIQSPDVMLTFAIGGDHLKDGNRVAAEALKTPELRDHYGIVEFKRLSLPHGPRKGDINAACDWLMEHRETVLSWSEIRRVLSILQDYLPEADSGRAEWVAQWLQQKAKDSCADKETVERVARFAKAIAEFNQLNQQGLPPNADSVLTRLACEMSDAPDARDRTPRGSADRLTGLGGLMRAVKTLPLPPPRTPSPSGGSGKPSPLQGGGKAVAVYQASTDLAQAARIQPKPPKPKAKSPKVRRGAKGRPQKSEVNK